MLVKELIAALKKVPQDVEVLFTYNSGDYWRTQVAASINQLDTGYVVWSQYHDMHKVIDLDDNDEDDEDNMPKTVVLLSVD